MFAAKIVARTCRCPGTQPEKYPENSRRPPHIRSQVAFCSCQHLRANVADERFEAFFLARTEAFQQLAVPGVDISRFTNPNKFSGFDVVDSNGCECHVDTSATPVTAMRIGKFICQISLTCLRPSMRESHKDQFQYSVTFFARRQQCSECRKNGQCQVLARRYKAQLIREKER